MRLRLGFIGLGTMGEPVANNLRKAGHELAVWARTPTTADRLVKKGALRAATPRACAEGRDAVFLCLADDQANEAVLDGPDGVLAGLAKGAVLVDLGTSGTRSTRAVGERVARQGAAFVAAPMLGSRSAAEQAQLVLVAGGPAEALAQGPPGAPRRQRPALRARLGGPRLAGQALHQRGGGGHGHRAGRGAGAGRLRRRRPGQGAGGAAGLLLPLPLPPDEGGADAGRRLRAAGGPPARREGPAAGPGGGRRAGGAGSRSTPRPASCSPRRWPPAVAAATWPWSPTCSSSGRR